MRLLDITGNGYHHDGYKTVMPDMDDADMIDCIMSIIIDCPDSMLDLYADKIMAIQWAYGCDAILCPDNRLYPALDTVAKDYNITVIKD